MLTCTNCQTPYQENQSFCTHCGQALAKANSFGSHELEQSWNASQTPQKTFNEQTNPYVQPLPSDSFYTVPNANVEKIVSPYSVPQPFVEDPTVYQRAQTPQQPAYGYPQNLHTQPGEPLQHTNNTAPVTPVAPKAPVGPTSPSQYGTGYTPTNLKSSLNRLSVAIAAILLGAVGLQYIMMRKWFRVFMCIAFTALAFASGIVYISTLPGMIGVMQGIRILCLTQEQFEELYLTVEDVVVPPPKQRIPYGTYPGL